MRSEYEENQSGSWSQHSSKRR